MTMKSTKKIGKATEVQAKFNALIQALSVLTTERAEQAVVFSDNEYIVRIMTDGWKVNDNYPSHVELHKRAVKLKNQIKDFKMKLIPERQLKQKTNM
jgi:ribonuclease HI